MRSLTLAALIAAGVSGAGLPVTPAAANPIERVMSTPTAWKYYYGLTPTQLTSVINTGYRVVDLQAESVSGSTPTFTATLVANSGAYGKGWWWYYGQSIAQVSAALTANNARLISIAPYVVNGTTYFASVMVSNTGADAKGWYWWVGTSAQIKADISATKARLVDLEPYSTSGGTRYAAIAINNSGTDADSWWWYLGDSLSGALNHVTTNKAQLLSFNKEPGASTYDITMQGGSTAPWWFYAGSDGSTLSQLLVENGARLTELRSDLSGGSRHFNSIMIDNSNACTSRLIGIGHAKGTGWNGNYVKQITGSPVVADGPVPCAAADARKFEPASAIKVVIATYAMHLVQTHKAALTDKVPLLDANNFCSFQQIGTETLGNAITQMMENSDNARTDMLLRRFGMGQVTNYAHLLGMKDTAFNGYVDCPGQHNTLTLDDAALLYTDLATHQILTAANVKQLFSMMAGRNYDFAGMWGDLQPIIHAEAPSNLPAAKLASFIAHIQLSYKSGGYTWPGGTPDLNGKTEYGDVGIDGYVNLPVCDGSVKKGRGFVFGFFHESTASDADQTPVFNAMGAGAELLREQVHQSLLTWGQCG